MTDPIEKFLIWVGGAPKEVVASLDAAQRKPRDVARIMESGFKKTPDGRIVFYPYGKLTKNGYVIASENDFRRLRALINLWIGLSTALVIVAFRRRGYAIAAAAWIMCSVIYWAWMRLTVQGLQREKPDQPA
jgi:hypothetical protein